MGLAWVNNIISTKFQNEFVVSFLLACLLSGKRRGGGLKRGVRVGECV